MSLPKCEHGVSRNDGRYVGTWAAPFSECGCCGVAFPYIDSGSYGSQGFHTTTWTPKDRCAACGGKYVEHRSGPVESEEPLLDRRMLVRAAVRRALREFGPTFDRLVKA
jgi:hypothetical protein